MDAEQRRERRKQRAKVRNERAQIVNQMRLQIEATRKLLRQIEKLKAKITRKLREYDIALKWKEFATKYRQKNPNCDVETQPCAALSDLWIAGGLPRQTGGMVEHNPTLSVEHLMNLARR